MNPKKEISDSLKLEIQNKYDEIGNIKEVAKIFHISYNKLKEFIIFKNKNRVKSKQPRNTSLYRKNIKMKMVDYKGGRCLICGYKKCIDALEFHHINPDDKDFNISGGTKSFDYLKSELDKCILVCANCHREIHAGLIDLNLII